MEEITIIIFLKKIRIDLKNTRKKKKHNKFLTFLLHGIKMKKES